MEKQGKQMIKERMKRMREYRDKQKDKKEKKSNKRGLIAQWLLRRSSKAEVEGSIPSRAFFFLSVAFSYLIKMLFNETWCQDQKILHEGESLKARSARGRAVQGAALRLQSRERRGFEPHRTHFFLVTFLSYRLFLLELI